MDSKLKQTSFYMVIDFVASASLVIINYINLSNVFKFNSTVTNAIYAQKTLLAMIGYTNLIVATSPIRNALTNAFERKSEIAANVINR